MRKRIVYREIEKPINADSLREELGAALGDIFLSVVSHKDKLRVALHAPTPADITTADQVVQAHNAASVPKMEQTLTTITAAIEPIVGKRIDDLKTADQWALLAGLLYQLGAINPDLTIRHPQHWIALRDVVNDTLPALHREK